MDVFQLKRELETRDQREINALIAMYGLLGHGESVDCDAMWHLAIALAAKGASLPFDPATQMPTKLDLYNQPFTARDVDAIARSLAQNGPLQVLSFKSNDDYEGYKLTNNDAIKIAKALMTNDTLISLDISGNDLGDKSAQAIADMLRQNKTLTVLGLAWNDFKTQGISKIMGALKSNTSLLRLDIRGLGLHEPKRLKPVIDMLKENNTLRALDLGSNDMYPEAADTLFEALTDNTGLTELLLKHNNIGSENFDALETALETNHSLITVDLEGNNTRPGDLERIAPFLERNGKLYNMRVRAAVRPIQRRVIDKIYDPDNMDWVKGQRKTSAEHWMPDETQ